MDLASRLYRSRVFHARLRPFRHRFTYAVFCMLVDLDELPALDRSRRLFGWNRLRPLGFHDRDHGPRDGSALRPWGEAMAAKAGIDDAAGPMRLLCFPRAFGQVFDPLTIWFLHDRDGRPNGLIHEVRNTFGESHAYVAALSPQNGVYAHDGVKRFHVSPFFDRMGAYRFRIAMPGEKMAAAIRLDGPDGPRLIATHTGAARPFSDREMAAALLRRPALGARVLGGIHWEALKLWRKGARFHPRPAAPRVGVSVEAPL